MMILKNSSAKVKKIRRISVVLFAVFIIILPSACLIVSKVMARFFFLYIFSSAVRTVGICSCLFAMFSFPFFSGYMMYCFGKTKTQSLHLYDKELVYGYYNRTDTKYTKNREFYTTYISSAASYRMINRYIYIYGVFRQDVTGRMNYDKKVKRVKIIRILEDEEERKMLRFLDGIIKDKREDT